LTDNIFIKQSHDYERKKAERDAMKRRDSLLWIIALLIMTGSDYAMSKRPQEKETRDNEEPLSVSMSEKRGAEGTSTFLDTLNRGKEIGLSDNDLKPILPESTSIADDKDNKGPTTEGFRVQCYASSQIDRIRSEQKQLEFKIKYPVYVVFNAPYYKLLVGDFMKKNEADIALGKLKEIGYTDAWVARSRINSVR
jgi:hypothetical protein